MTSASASRVTRSSRSLRRTLLLFGCCLAVAGILRAQDSTPGAADAAGPATAAGPASPAVETAAAAEPGADGEGQPAGAEPLPTPVPAPADAAAGKTARPPAAGTSPSRFEPTEKVRADFDVSFPIDI